MVSGHLNRISIDLLNDDVSTANGLTSYRAG